MSDDRSALKGGQEGLEARLTRLVRSSAGENMIRRLNVADWLSLGALLWAWVAALLLVNGQPNFAIVAVMAGFVFDKLDGYYARRYDLDSAFGRQIDSFIDIFVYLVPAALLYHVAMAPAGPLRDVVSLAVGFTVLMFGGLRLVRHNDEGFDTDADETSYYIGTTVVHTHIVVLANYFLLAFSVPLWNGWLAGLTIVAVCPLMTSRYRAAKTDFGHALVAAFGALTVALALVLEFGLPAWVGLGP
jgi:CDP-diacylglycerol--serine O-phosphatidyltransferase